jgi:hypothetical protein
MERVGHRDRYAMLTNDPLRDLLADKQFSLETWVGTYRYSARDGELILNERPDDGVPITHVIARTENISEALGKMNADFVRRQPMEDLEDDYYRPSGREGCTAIALAILLGIWVVTGVGALLTILF